VKGRSAVVDRIVSRWWLVVIVTLVGAGLGFGRYALSDPTYAATSTLLIGQPLSDARVDPNALETGQRLAATYADLAIRQPVLDGAVQQLGLDVTWQSLRARVHASVPADQSPLVVITAEASSPDAATALAGAVDDQVIAASPTATEDVQVSDIRSFVQGRLTRTQHMLADAQTRLDQLRRQETNASGAHADALRVRVARQESHVLDLQQSYTTLLSFVSSGGVTNSVSVLETPTADTAPVGAGPVSNVLAGALLGFLLGVGLAYAFGRRPQQRVSGGGGGGARYAGESDRPGLPVGQRGSTWNL
jgi:capsular polysaccharide biosynthesis protein